MRVIWSPLAVRDLIAVRAHIPEHDPQAADGVAAQLRDAVASLSRFPGMGRPGRVAHTRELVVAGTPYVLPYTVEDGCLKIIAVIHMARRWPEDP